MKEAGDAAECRNPWGWVQNQMERSTFPSHGALQLTHLNSLPAMQVKGEDEERAGA